MTEKSQSSLPSDVLPDLAPGTIVGSYEVIDTMHGGGLAKAYVARHRVFPRKAVLVLAAWREDTEARFKRWLEHLARLDHPNIVSLYDCGEYQGHPYAVLRHVEGRSLSEIVDQGEQQDLITLLRLFRTLAGALAYCHEQGLVHRNLKPACVLIDDTGTPFVTDFTIATSLEGDPIDASNFFVTPTWVAPETVAYGNAIRDGWRPSERSLALGDVWSFGLLMYLALVGEGLFKPVAVRTEIPREITSPNPVDLSKLRECVPLPVVELVSRCLEKTPERRYRNGTDLERALDALIDHLLGSTGQLKTGAPIAGKNLLLYFEPERDDQRGKYIEVEVDSIVGSGSFGEVYAVRRARVGARPRATVTRELHETAPSKGLPERQPFALKVLQRHVSEDAEVVERFRREARSLPRIESQHVVNVFGFGRYGSGHFIAMELLDGRPLSESIESGGMCAVTTAVRIVTQIASGLNAIHAAGFVHRDLKPANVVMVDRGRRAVIADFGLVRELAAPRMTQTGAFCGTPRYAAPEQLSGGEMTPSADVYSLGVVFYELLAGRSPYESGSSSAVLREVLAGSIVPLPDLRRGVPDEISQAVHRLMALTPSDRLGLPELCEMLSACDVEDDTFAAASDSTIDARRRSR